METDGAGADDATAEPADGTGEKRAAEERSRRRMTQRECRPNAAAAPIPTTPRSTPRSIAEARG